jgi:phosphatidylglycerol---prolipoprotein diacylglyceryl transferase
MFPRLLHHGTFYLPTYGFMAALGLIVALLVTFKLAKKNGVDPDDAWNLGIIVILSGILGAKILMLIVDWRHYQSDLFSTMQAGGVFSGGVVAAFIAGTWYVRRRGMPWLKTADVFAPGLALGHAFGRLGCFAAGCCYGRETTLPWAVTFSDAWAHKLSETPLGVHLHPTQIYEFLVEITNFFLLLWLIRRKRFDGQIIGTYLFVYGFARFFLEFLRGDAGRGQFFDTWMTTTQFIAILMVVGGGVLWMLGARKPVLAEAA